MSIPARRYRWTSQAIHGITDDKVKSADGFEAAYTSYLGFAGGHLVLGYSLGFDLAVLKAEHERAGLPWKTPRALDVRDLVRVLNPPLPDFSLDKIAAWLGVDVQGRHTALGDAIVTGEIYLALLPRLREVGIRTLAEAEEACRRKISPGEAPAAWLELGVTPAAGALARVDSYPYRHRVRDVMATPPQMIAPESDLGAALQALVTRKISSLFVTPIKPDGPHGIITERDILRAVAANTRGALAARR